MTPQEAYKKFLLKANKNDTNKNVKIPKSQFVLIFNEEKRKYLDNIITEYENSDYIEAFSELLEVDKPLVKLDENKRIARFALPNNLFSRVSSYSVASRGKCKDVVLVNWFVKPKNIEVLLQNENQGPSFDYRETIAILDTKGIVIYKDNFNIDNAYITYYREPKDLDIEGYTKLDGSPSTNVETDMSDGNIEYIIDLAVVEALRNYESIEQLQLALQREKTDFKS